MFFFAFMQVCLSQAQRIEDEKLKAESSLEVSCGLMNITLMSLAVFCFAEDMELEI